MEVRSKSAYQKRKQISNLNINTNNINKPHQYAGQNSSNNLTELLHLKTKFHHPSNDLRYHTTRVYLKQGETEISRSAIRQLQQLYTPSIINSRQKRQSNTLSNNYINIMDRYDCILIKQQNKESQLVNVNQNSSLNVKIQEERQNNRRLTVLYQSQKLKYEEQKQKNRQLKIALMNLSEIYKKNEQQSHPILNLNSDNQKKHTYQNAFQNGQNEKISELKAQLKKQMVINLQLQECMAKYIQKKELDKQKIQKLSIKINDMQKKYLEYISNLKQEFLSKKRIGQIQIDQLLKQIQTKDRQLQTLKEFAYENRHFNTSTSKIKKNGQKSSFFTRFIQFSKELEVKCDVNRFSTLNSMIGTTILNGQGGNLASKRSHSLHCNGNKHANTNVQVKIDSSSIDKTNIALG